MLVRAECFSVVFVCAEMSEQDEFPEYLSVTHSWACRHLNIEQFVFLNLIYLYGLSDPHSNLKYPVENLTSFWTLVLHCRVIPLTEPVNMQFTYSPVQKYIF